jgi:two-component system LytT family response regulator
MIKCIAIDDEPLALRQIKSYIEKTPGLELCGLYNSPTAALEWLKEQEVDLIFIDINMPDMSGLEFVRTLENRPLIIFTTAYAEYAVEGFRLNAADYLLKPFSLSDFQQSIKKVASLHELIQLAKERSLQEESEGSEGLSEALPEGKEFIGWFSETTDAHGNVTLSLVFAPSDSGTITLADSYVLEPMVLHARFDTPKGE